MKVSLTQTLTSLLALVLATLCVAQEVQPATGSAAAAESKSDRDLLIEKLKTLLEDVEANGATLEKLEQIGDLYLEGRDVERAVLVFQKAIADFGGSEALFLKFSRIMAFSGSQENAIEVLNIGLKQFPESQAITLELGKAYIALEKPYAAIANLKKLVEQNPENESYRYHLADAYRLQKKWIEASALIDALVDSETELLQVYLMKGDLMLAQGEMRDGVRYLEDLLEEHPDSPMVKEVLLHAYQIYAYSESKAGRLSRAVRSMRSSLEVDPDNSESMVALASFLSELGDYEEAETNLKKVLELNPNYLEVYVVYGRMLEQLDRVPEAASIYQEGLAKSRELGVEGAIGTFRQLLGIRQ